jgi:hypothetical protein
MIAGGGRPRNALAAPGRASAEIAPGSAYTPASMPVLRTNSRRESGVAFFSFNRFSGNADNLL